MSTIIGDCIGLYKSASGLHLTLKNVSVDDALVPRTVKVPVTAALSAALSLPSGADVTLADGARDALIPCPALLGAVVLLRGDGVRFANAKPIGPTLPNGCGARVWLNGTYEAAAEVMEKCVRIAMPAGIRRATKPAADAVPPAADYVPLTDDTFPPEY